MVDLPQELLNEIINYLPLSSIRDVSTINKLFYEIFTNLDWDKYLICHNPSIKYPDY